MNASRVLLIVDAQNDFITGSLAIDGAVAAMDRLTRWIEEQSERYDAVVLTMDQHPYYHCSFVEQGGIWPRHCVRYSYGASLYEPLYQALSKVRQSRPSMPVLYLEKAVELDYDEYSAFSHEIPELLLGAEHIYLAGLAGDYCVAYSRTDLLRSIPEERIELLEDCIAYVHPQNKEEK